MLGDAEFRKNGIGALNFGSGALSLDNFFMTAGTTNFRSGLTSLRNGISSIDGLFTIRGDGGLNKVVSINASLSIRDLIGVGVAGAKRSGPVLVIVSGAFTKLFSPAQSAFSPTEASSQLVKFTGGHGSVVADVTVAVFVRTPVATFGTTCAVIEIVAVPLAGNTPLVQLTTPLVPTGGPAQVKAPAPVTETF